ncbi:hypothetical protein GT360_12850 [Vibrio astriarenae]|uniref:Uncharacterized protein n=1 Tax=Vibrio astriarenae TaxID=1481923 RepID=A0A7Z2YEE0_9VIBR|nr:hypothetical protein [Vibrio astriarenae]QIA64337.1 hypothetical protein GT360_12850 [Vibrio astriarenae]
MKFSKMGNVMQDSATQSNNENRELKGQNADFFHSRLSVAPMLDWILFL